MKSSYKTKLQQLAEGALEDLPVIDYDTADGLLQRGECFSVPKGWPRNWQWLLAMKTAAEKIAAEEQGIATAQERIAQLRASLTTFREVFDRGDLWPGLKEVSIACIKGGFETTILKRGAIK